MSDLNFNTEITDEKLGERAEQVMKSGSFDFSEEPPWLKHAQTCLNLKSESAGEFVNTMLKSCDLPENPNKTFPISFASYGNKCDFVPGGIVVFDDHVGIILSVDSHSLQIISCYKKLIQITDASEHGDIITCRCPDNFAL